VLTLPCRLSLYRCADSVLLCWTFTAILNLQEQLMEQTVAQTADSSGRLPPDALKTLLMLQAQAAGGPLQADRLLQR
jgi:hypothetical protein